MRHMWTIALMHHSQTGSLQCTRSIIHTDVGRSALERLKVKNCWLAREIQELTFRNTGDTPCGHTH